MIRVKTFWGLIMCQTLYWMLQVHFSFDLDNHCEASFDRWANWDSERLIYPRTYGCLCAESWFKLTFAWLQSHYSYRLGYFDTICFWEFIDSIPIYPHNKLYWVLKTTGEWGRNFVGWKPSKSRQCPMNNKTDQAQRTGLWNLESRHAHLGATPGFCGPCFRPKEEIPVMGVKYCLARRGRAILLSNTSFCTVLCARLSSVLLCALYKH